MVRGLRSKKELDRRSKRLQSLLQRSNRGWVLDPISSEREDWDTECVRGKREEESEDTQVSVPEDISDEYDD